MAQLDNAVIEAVLDGKIKFNDDLPSPRWCSIGELRFVRPVVGKNRWCLIVGRNFDHVPLNILAHMALEYARMGWQSRAAKEASHG